MARKKTITRDQILDAAYDVVAADGFARFTARNIAAEMNCSTQPIYLEFQNMDDLKNALIDKILNYLATDVFPIEHTGNTIIDLALNYIEFATTKRRLYRAMYLEEYGGGKKIQKFSYDYFVQAVKDDENYQNLSQEELEELHMGTWIVATGIASLMSSGIIAPTEDQIKGLMEESIRDILNDQLAVQLNY
ncbi:MULTISPECIES: TetR/AcrR family transcriptional regulator [Enterococcus]|uniref:TetR/AcrR family transcriptional regulator n=1 Tax=Enterococcus TaxID=1350 RepID=UPI0010FA5002|nr:MULTISPECIES: TetR/AcrR family transcriptional regulator [Enterococcus]KAF1301359.1 TetR family transcriptional regulator [Enterococcus sp. JM9B]